MVFPTYVSISSGDAVLQGTGRAFPTEKFIPAVSLSAPPGPYVAPNLSGIVLVTILAVQDPRPRPLSVGPCRRMPSSARIWSPERRRGRPGLLRSCLRSWSPSCIRSSQPCTVLFAYSTMSAILSRVRPRLRSLAAFSLSRDLPGGSFLCISDSCDMLTSGRNSPLPFYLQCSWHGGARIR